MKIEKWVAGPSIGEAQMFEPLLDWIKYASLGDKVVISELGSEYTDATCASVYYAIGRVGGYAHGMPGIIVNVGSTPGSFIIERTQGAFANRIVTPDD